MLQRADQGEENADQSCQVNSSMWPGPAAAHTQPVEYYSAALGAMLRDWRDSKGTNFPLGTMQLPPSTVRENAFLAPFYAKNDHSTKIGSGQTWEKLSKKAFSAGGKVSRPSGIKSDVGWAAGYSCSTGNQPRTPAGKQHANRSASRGFTKTGSRQQ